MKKIKLGCLLENLTQRHNRREQVSLDDCDSERCACTQIIQEQKNQSIILLVQFDRSCNVLSVFGFYSAK